MLSPDTPLSRGAMSVDAFARWAGVGRIELAYRPLEKRRALGESGAVFLSGLAAAPALILGRTIKLF